MSLSRALVSAWLAACAATSAGADAWPPAWAAEDCRYGASLKDVKPIGWEGHHEYDLFLDVETWEAGGKVVMDLSSAGELAIEPSQVVNAEMAHWEASGLVLRLKDAPKNNEITLHVRSSSAFIRSKVEFLCSAWPSPPPPPSPPPHSPPPPSPPPPPPPQPPQPSPPPPSPTPPTPPPWPSTPPPSPPPSFTHTLGGKLVLIAGLLAVVAGGLFFGKDRLLGMTQHRKGGHMQRVHNDDDTMDGDEEDDDEDDEDEDGDDDEDDGDGEEGDDLEAGGAQPPEGLTIKAFVALGNQVHAIVLPLDGIDSWGSLSQTIHEVCEDSDVPDLPVHGIMHIVLNVNGATVPVTGKTPIEELWRAKAIKVSITAESTEDGDGDDGDDDGDERGRPLRQAAE